MIKMTEINAQLRQNMTEQLQDIKDLPEDLALGYKNWVQGLVKKASEQITQELQPAGQPTEGGAA